jgi:REP element-mobilizing transposase RayT
MIIPRKFQNKYRVDTFRLKNWDYGAPGLYFITICTQNRIPYFVNPAESHDCATPIYTEIGKIANQFWAEIPTHFPFVEIDEFVIMHDHMHGIIFINKPYYLGWRPNVFGPQSKNLGSIVRAYKSSVKRYANQNNIDFGWQSLYHEKAIRSERAIHNIRQYIKTNPEKHDWETHNCASSQKSTSKKL